MSHKNSLVILFYFIVKCQSRLKISDDNQVHCSLIVVWRWLCHYSDYLFINNTNKTKSMQILFSWLSCIIFSLYSFGWWDVNLKMWQPCVNQSLQKLKHIYIYISTLKTTTFLKKVQLYDWFPKQQINLAGIIARLFSTHIW